MNTRRVKILRRKSWLGKILRLPFDLIPKTAILPIISGLLKGTKWIKGSHNISVLLGTYERKQSIQFLKIASSASVFWDLGAHVGYYSLLYAKANPTGKIYAFEPIEGNVSLYIKHMALNNVLNFKVFESAVSDTYSKLSFNTTATSVAGKLSENGNITVDVVKLSDLTAKGKIEVPQLIKMDIEGEEFKVLTDLRDLLTTYKPGIFLSTHGARVHKNCLNLLAELNYVFVALDSNDLESSKEIFAHSG